MIVKIAKTGTSFKGVLAYHLHDKRQEGQAVRVSSERVAWTHTRNIMTNDAHLAGKVMAATAMDQERLKRDAGIKATGRKSAQSVYSYSLAWHPEEAANINKTEMMRAADESLLAIGAADRQAIIVCHQDQAHPHVHVIVNRVSMDDGRMLSTSNDRKKLDKWALGYREARGEEERYCPVRKAKADAIKKREAGQTVDFIQGDRPIPTGMERDFKEAKKAAPSEAERVRAQEKEKDAALSVAGKSQAHRHKREWVDLGDKYRHKHADIKAQAKAARARATEQIKEQFRPNWRDLYRNQNRETRLFEKREQRLAGKVENALLAIAHRRQLDPDGSRGLMGHAFNFLTSKRARTAALEKLHRIEQRQLSQAQREEIGRAHASIDADQTMLQGKASKTYNLERAALIERQDEEKKHLKARWKDRTAERRRAFDTIKRKATVRQAAKEQQPEAQVKEDFIRAAKGRRKRTRSRSRSRRIDDE